MSPVPRYFTTASKAPRVAPGDLPGAIGVTPAPDDPTPIGIAYASGHLGGWKVVFDGPNRDWTLDSYHLGKQEATWRLVVAKVEVDGRFALRGGEFVGLAEGAE